MGEFGNAIKYLYQQFILRDILSFVTPGAIVVLSASLLLLPGACLSQRLSTLFGYSISIHWLLYIPLFGVFYMTGFAVQCFGEITGIIRIHRIAASGFGQRLLILLKRTWVNDARIWWIRAHRERVAFNEYTNEETHRNEREWARQQDERLVVLKQMCANGSLAIAIAGSFVAFNYCPWIPAKLGWMSLWAIVLLGSLFWGYCAHELRLDTMDRAVRHLNQRR